jgi:transcriptional regulator with XRE-family HTH domain
LLAPEIGDITQVSRRMIAELATEGDALMRSSIVYATNLQSPRKFDPIEIALAKRVRTLREEREIVLRELARRIGISAPQLSKYANCKLSIPAHVLLKLSKALDVSIDMLFRDSPEPQLESASETAALPKWSRKTKLLRAYGKLGPKEQEALVRIVSAMAR